MKKSCTTKTPQSIMEKTDREGENVMQALFDAVNAICGKIQVVSDLFWEFPTNFGWYAAIPILGNFSLAIILLVGTGIFLTFRFRFVQVRKFKYGLKVLLHSKAATKTGISALAAFLLSTAMRVGPGNILGVTGAISIGGPGALFWMWLSAFFGMSTAFAESTLSQIFKEKRDGQYVGGLPFYGRRLLNNAAWAGVALSVLYIVYAFLCFPAQGFNTISAVGAIANEITGTTIATNSTLYWISFVVLILIAALISFGGIKKVTKVTDLLVPVMAVIYVLTVIALVVCNFTRIPWFFQAVFGQAFSPDAVFGGAFGTVLSQGIKRGLMSNEAGQGTITMPAAAADANHPCDQGCVQAIGVFLDTIVICTLTGFVVIMGRMWTTDRGAEWFDMGKLDKFLASERRLSDRNVFSEHLLWSVCIYLSDRLYVLYGNVRGADFFAQGFYCSDPAAVPVRHFLWRHYQYRGNGSGRALGFKRFCQYSDGLLQPAAAVSWSEVCNPGVEALRKTGRYALYV